MGCEGAIGNLRIDSKREGSGNRQKRFSFAIFGFSKRSFDVASRFKVDGNKSDPTFRCGRDQRCHCKLNVWVTDGPQYRHALEIRYDFFEELQSFPICLGRGFEGYSGHISTGMRETLDEPNFDRSAYPHKHRRHVTGYVLCPNCPHCSLSDEQVDLGQQGNNRVFYFVGLGACKLVQQHDVPTWDIAEVRQPLFESFSQISRPLRCSCKHDAYPPNLAGLLSIGSPGPRRRSATNYSYEISAPHSITSSRPARCRIVAIRGPVKRLTVSYHGKLRVTARAASLPASFDDGFGSTAVECEGRSRA